MSKVKVKPIKSPKELQAEKLFQKYKNKFIRELGRRPTVDTELNRIGKYLFGSKFKGVYAKNEQFPLKSGFYIINSDLAKNPGIHWLGMVLTKKTSFIFDSFGRNPHTLIKHLTDRIKQSGRSIKYDIYDREQRDKEVICGQMTLAWLSVAKELGIKAAMTI